MAFGGALAAASAALESARTSAEPLEQPHAFAPDNVLDMAHELAKSPFKAPGSTLPDVFSNLNFEQYSAIRRNPGSAVWNDEKLGFELEPLHRGFIFATPMQLFVVENGQAQRLIYDRAAYDFGKPLASTNHGGSNPSAGGTKAPSSAYDDAVRLLSFALSDALEMALKSAAGPLTETETLGVVKRLTNNVMEAFDRGERERSALKRAALREILVSPANPRVGMCAEPERRNMGSRSASSGAPH